MQFTVTTTITTQVDADTFETEHSVDIAVSDDISHNVVRAAATGALRSALQAVEDQAD